jgi:protocatechuate 3,4-dioxygenase beta subunit
MRGRLSVWAGLGAVLLVVALVVVLAFVVGPQREYQDAAAGYTVVLAEPFADDEGLVPPGEIPEGVCVVGAGPAATAGVVLTDDGTPLSGALVLLVPWRGGPRRGVAALGRRVREILASPWRVASRRGGHFSFEGIEPGPWRLVALQAGFLPRVSPVLDVVPGEPGEAEIVLTTGPEIAGRVVDDRGVALEGSAVRARWSFGANRSRGRDADALLETALGSLPRDEITDADGRFSFPAVPAGAYELLAVKDGYARSSPVSVEGGDTDVEIVLETGFALQGRVTGTGGVPLAGAEVLAVTADGRDAARSAVRAVASAGSVPGPVGTETDQQGRFLIADVRAGTYAVLVRREEYQPGIFLGIRMGGDRKAPLEFKLEPGRVLEGRVVAPDKEPVAEARVTILTSLDPHDPVYPRFETATDARGRFRFTTLSPVAYRLKVTCEGFAPLERDLPRPSDRLVLRLVPGGTITGRVTDGAAGIAAAKVTVQLDTGEEDEDVNGRRRASRMAAARTDGAGRFTLANISGGSGSLLVEARGYAFFEQPIEIAAGEAREVDLVLAPSGWVRGRVVGARSGEPLAGAKLFLEQDQEAGGADGRGPARYRRFSGAASSDRGGMWELPLPVPGTGFRVRASHPEYLPQLSDRFAVARVGADGPSLTLGLSRGVTLCGLVSGPAGDPLSGIRVSVRRRRGGDRSEGEESRAVADRLRGAVWGTLSSEGGSWAIEPLFPGPYTLWVDHVGYAPYRHEFDLPAEEGKEKRWTITLTEEAYIGGAVVTRKGDPVGGASVSVSGTGVSRLGYSDQNGTFLIGGLAPGASCTISLRKAGFLFKRLRDVLAPQDHLVCSLVRPAELSGRVVGAAEGEGVHPIRLTFRASENVEGRAPEPRVFNARNGFFAVAGIPPGTYDLVVESTRFPPVRLENLTLEEGAARRDLEIGMDAGLLVTGTVMTARKRPAAGAVVQAIPAGQPSGEGKGAGGPESPVARTRPPRARLFQRGEEELRFLRAGVGRADGRGRFVLMGLAPGRYVVEAFHNDWATARSEVVAVEAGAPAPSVGLTLERGFALTVTVRLQDGQPGKEVDVTLRGPDKLVSRRTDGAGRVRFRGLSKGTYSLRAVLDRRATSERVSVKVTDTDATATIAAWR